MTELPPGKTLQSLISLQVFFLFFCKIKVIFRQSTIAIGKCVQWCETQKASFLRRLILWDDTLWRMEVQNTNAKRFSVLVTRSTSALHWAPIKIKNLSVFFFFGLFIYYRTYLIICGFTLQCFSARSLADTKLQRCFLVCCGLAHKQDESLSVAQTDALYIWFQQGKDGRVFFFFFFHSFDTLKFLCVVPWKWVSGQHWRKCNAVETLCTGVQIMCQCPLYGWLNVSHNALWSHAIWTSVKHKQQGPYIKQEVDQSHFPTRRFSLLKWNRWLIK